MQRLQKILGIDLKYVFKNGGIISVSHTIGTGFGFVVTLLLANFVDSTTYGQYKYVVSVAGVLGAFTLSGAGSAVLQAVSKGYEGLLHTEEQRYKLWSTPSLILAFIFGSYYVIQGDHVLGWGVILMTVINYVQNIFLLHVSFLNGKKDFVLLAKNQIISSSLVALSIAGVTLTGYTTIIYIILAYHGSQTLFQIWAHRRTLKKYTPNTAIHETEQKLSVHLSIMNVINIISEYIDKVLIFQFLGPYQLAVYTFSVGIPDQLRSINKLINAIVIPKLNTKSDTDLIYSVRKHTRTYVLITIALSIIFALSAHTIYSVFFPQYIESVRYAQIYILILPLIALGILAGNALQIKGLIKSIYLVRTVDSIIKIALFVVLIPLLGVLGAIIAVLASKGFTIIVQIILYTKWKRSVLRSQQN